MIGPFGHLGADASALADDSLDDARTSWARSHILGCSACAVAVRELRRQRRLTASLGEVEVPRTLEERLLALGATTQSAQDSDGGAPGGALVRGSASWEPTPRRGHIRLIAVAAASVIGVGIAASGTLVMLGSSRTTSPDGLTSLVAAPVPTTSHTRSADATAASTGAVPVALAAQWPAGWPAPELPAGAVVSAIEHLPTGEVRVDLVIDDEAVTVVESHGVLDLTDSDVRRSVLVGGMQAHLVGDWWVAQAGTEIVAVTAPSPDLGLAVIKEFDSSGTVTVLDSLARGWQVVAGG